MLADSERQHAGTLVFVVACGAGGHVNEWGDVSATVVMGVGISVDGVVVTATAIVVGIVVGSIVEMLGW